jgi:hypothetical protein
MTRNVLGLLTALLVLVAMALLFRGALALAAGGLVVGGAAGLWARRRATRPSEIGIMPPSAAPPAPRPLDGALEIGGTTWGVTEEKRGGPFAQLLILRAQDEGAGVMHVRPPPGQPATSLEEVEVLAGDPAYRYFGDRGGLRWQVRIVESVGEDGRARRLAKFISKDGKVREGPYPGSGGLGHWTDAELRDLLERTAEVGG